VGGLLFDGMQYYANKTYDLQIIDRFGTGDTFATGLIHGLTQQWRHDRTIGFAIAAASLKHTIPGDLALMTEEDINTILQGHTSGHVER